ncbi:unnamed protein product [Ectocarpus sp. CCAP 1310/34]|nr:unnamed protein product [Ectocarpus sp. CCAP 1310/34]
MTKTGAHWATSAATTTMMTERDVMERTMPAQDTAWIPPPPINRRVFRSVLLVADRPRELNTASHRLGMTRDGCPTLPAPSVNALTPL